MPIFIDLTGKRFHKLLVIGHARVRRSGIRQVQIHYWKSRCDCGVEVEVDGQGLRRGSTTSCGCVGRAAVTSHGATKVQNPTREYRIYGGMKSRCRNPNHRHYARYGGRGITVCERWLGPEGFTNFLADVGKRPSPKHSLDRFPDKDGNYEPGNVRWATWKQQQNNRSNNREVSFNGETLNFTQWAARIGISPELLRWRLSAGWSLDRAFVR